ncbi:MAG: Holliday junction resolvase RuvX [Chlorobi bacterium]|nr:Holliday junction resolvase RuvX [Chlorobiota bacterium]MBX7216249.1 Holliday junction resolvase RuvX [Candidatus Kapabacteria bacterium]
MRALAVDHGAVRIGLAISDELGMLARPLVVVNNSPNAAQQIAQIARDESVGIIVVGMPHHLDGRETDSTRRVQEFVAQLTPAAHCPVVEWDEAYTTRDAGTLMIASGVKKKKRSQRGQSDLWAAAIILQRWLDAQPR